MSYPRGLGQYEEPYRATGMETPGECAGMPPPDGVCIDRQWVVPVTTAPITRQVPTTTPTTPTTQPTTCPPGYVLTSYGSCRPAPPEQPTEPPPPVDTEPVVVNGVITEWGGCPPGFVDVLDSSMPSGHRCDPTTEAPPEAVEEEVQRRQAEILWYEQQAAAGAGTTVSVTVPGAAAKGDAMADLLKKWLPIAAGAFLLLRGGGS